MNNMFEELIAEQHDAMGRYRMVNNPQMSNQTPNLPQLIDIEERKNLNCATCGTNLSVKYRLVVNGKSQCFCNKCILTVNRDN